MTFFKKHLQYFLFLIILLLGALLRFYKPDWGNGYFFNPDEYHIIGAVGRLVNDGFLANPKLFSYGSFTVYLIYAIRSLIISFTKTDIPNLFIVGRVLAAFFSTLTLVNIYLISIKIFFKEPKWAFLPTLIAALTPGLIQQAHFLTPESFMTFWITLSTYFLIRFYGNQKISDLIFSAASIGVAGGTKISSFAALPFMAAAIFLFNIKKVGILKNVRRTALFLIMAVVFFFVTFPYAVLDYESFRGTTRYESSLSFGKTKVFYTRAFEGSPPVIFQLTKVLPYSLGPAVLLFSIFGIATATRKVFVDKKNRVYFLTLLGMFLSYFIFNGFLYTKWTRFIHPAIPYLIIFSVVGIYQVSRTAKKPSINKLVTKSLIFFLIVPTVIWSAMFFSIYARKDVRSSATQWINKNIPRFSQILTETGNTVEVPLGGGYGIIPFDFYNLDADPRLYNQFLNHLTTSDYFIIQSRRIYKNHSYEEFPKVYNFYNALFSNELGFEEIAVFTSYPKLKIENYQIEIPDGEAEETWTVFDHPVIAIYKKSVFYSRNYYDKLLKK